MSFDDKKLEELRARFGGKNEGRLWDKEFKAVSDKISPDFGSRPASFMGLPTMLDAPYKEIDWTEPNFEGVDIALIGVPMDLGVSNRSGARFGPRAVRSMERVGPYNHVLKNTPIHDSGVYDIGDVPFRSRLDLELSHEDIERTFNTLQEAGIIPVAVGGDHSITAPILRALAKEERVALIHFDAHCDTAGPLEGCRFYHGGPFRQAVLDGSLDPTKTIQIGIRGAAEYLWEFSYESGMTVIHAEDLNTMSLEKIVRRAKEVVGDTPTYITFDIDCLDPAFAPGTGTPEVGGLTTNQALTILRGLTDLNLIGGDVVEIAPDYDATTNTAHAGAQILFEILSLISLSQEQRSRA